MFYRAIGKIHIEKNLRANQMIFLPHTKHEPKMSNKKDRRNERCASASSTHAWKIKHVLNVHQKKFNLPAVEL